MQKKKTNVASSSYVYFVTLEHVRGNQQKSFRCRQSRNQVIDKFLEFGGVQCILECLAKNAKKLEMEYLVTNQPNIRRNGPNNSDIFVRTPELALERHVERDLSLAAVTN